MLHPQNDPSLPAATLPLSTFDAFALAEPLMRGLAACGFHCPTEIQARAIPIALEGRDVLASAQTGTGKTAAFVLPALQRLLTAPAAKGRGPRVLVLTPTRELAAQVNQVIVQLGRATRLRTGSIVGGVSYEPQERLLRNSLDLLVATPGRLIDHMERGAVDFSRLELFVLDEADRMLDMGFIRPVRQIAAALPAQRQTMLFSATIEDGVQDIARRLLHDPVQIRLASAKVRHEAIEQRVHMAGSPETKLALLRHLLADPELTQAIVFIATKRAADRLAKRLDTYGVSCAPLHGNMRQSARARTVESLRSGKVRVLVATDVAARGIDLLGISHVINFDLPMVAEDYIHRIGRTGRNGATGVAISLVGPLDRVKLANIQRLTGQTLVPQTVKGLGPLPSSAPGSASMTAAPKSAGPAAAKQTTTRGRNGGAQGRPAAPARAAGAPPRAARPAAEPREAAAHMVAPPSNAVTLSRRTPVGVRSFRPRRGWN